MKSFSFALAGVAALVALSYPSFAAYPDDSMRLDRDLGEVLTNWDSEIFVDQDPASYSPKGYMTVRLLIRFLARTDLYRLPVAFPETGAESAWAQSHFSQMVDIELSRLSKVALPEFSQAIVPLVGLWSTISSCNKHGGNADDYVTCYTYGRVYKKAAPALIAKVLETLLQGKDTQIQAMVESEFCKRIQKLGWPTHTLLDPSVEGATALRKACGLPERD